IRDRNVTGVQTCALPICGRTVYVLDEPTTGLHFDDIRRLMAVLDGLVAKGNTVMVIEHNLDVIKCADWVIDLGPEGGSGGGLVVAEGTPEDVAKVPASHTGHFLAELLGTDATPSFVPVTEITTPARPKARSARRKAAARKQKRQREDSAQPVG